MILNVGTWIQLPTIGVIRRARRNRSVILATPSAPAIGIEARKGRDLASPRLGAKHESPARRNRHSERESVPPTSFRQEGRRIAHDHAGVGTPKHANCQARLARIAAPAIASISDGDARGWARNPVRDRWSERETSAVRRRVRSTIRCGPSAGRSGCGSPVSARRRAEERRNR